jgi:hypothetical protein
MSKPLCLLFVCLLISCRIEKPDGTLIILGNAKHYTNSSSSHDMFLLHIDAEGAPL